ncbi:TIGR00725 family protein [Deferribacter autotrophicus]|uniref:TIGR00725 family protein n=1 Tax=Deferribacter autotrophicus TaxID=500465 RepID=A0A5A8F863_9BACT|nr:TIGR00725 family protein [Deferribacter autotrophicus]KAA0258522.1 TIGR00725 family protein [Deferribacter autotrophicus]
MKSVSVIGTAKFDSHLCFVAETVGSILAKKGFAIISGGLGGIMEYAFKGAKKENGLTIGIIPSYNKSEANKYCDIVIPSGMGHARNILVVSSGDIVVSVGGEYGTTSEIAIALKLNKHVISYKSPINHENNFMDVDTFINKIKGLL